MIDPSRAFGTVITVGAGVIALDMVSHLDKNVRRGKSRMKPPTFRPMFTASKHFKLKW